MRTGWLVSFAFALALAVAISSPSIAHAQAYTERFLGWSRDHSFYAITQAGTDGIDLPVFCLGHRGAPPPSWPKDVAPPAADDDRGCTDVSVLYDQDQVDPARLVADARALVVAPTTADAGPHGETVTVKAVADRSMIEVDVSRSRKPLGRAYFYADHGSGRVPDLISAAWRDDGLAVAVEAGYAPAADPPPGFGPPTYLVIIPLDGSAANAARPPTARERSSALNIEGMKLLGAHRLDEAQRRFVAASEADPTYSIPPYNLASVASLRHDAGPAVAALLRVVDLAGTDPEAKRALVHGKTDHDLDFIASQSPYVTRLLGRPRVAGDDWCIAAEQRARNINLVNFDGSATAAGTLIDATAYAGIPAGRDPELTCFVHADRSQLTVTMYVEVKPKAGGERIVTVAWEIFPDGFFDADAFLDDSHTKTLSLKALDRIKNISHTIAGK